MIAVLLMLIVAACGPPAWAHEPYSQWRAHSGASCCNNKDCAPVRHQVRADGTYLDINGQWWRANRNEAREQQPIDGDAHACVLPGASRPICYALPWSAS